MKKVGGNEAPEIREPIETKEIHGTGYCDFPRVTQASAVSSRHVSRNYEFDFSPSSLRRVSATGASPRNQKRRRIEEASRDVLGIPLGIFFYNH